MTLNNIKITKNLNSNFILFFVTLNLVLLNLNIISFNSDLLYFSIIILLNFFLIYNFNKNSIATNFFPFLISYLLIIIKNYISILKTLKFILQIIKIIKLKKIYLIFNIINIFYIFFNYLNLTFNIFLKNIKIINLALIISFSNIK